MRRLAAVVVLGSACGLLACRGSREPGDEPPDAAAEDAGGEPDAKVGPSGPSNTDVDAASDPRDASSAADAGGSSATDTGTNASDAGRATDASDAGSSSDAAAAGSACEAQGAARCYYATPAGAGDCSLLSPCSLAEAWSQLRAGDFLYLRNGTYSLSQSLLTARAGSADAPITLRGYGAETALIASNGVGDVIAVEHPYWVLRNLHFEASNMPDHDHGIISVGGNGEAHHVSIERCRLNLVSSAGHDNISAIRLQASRSSQARIVDNDVRGFKDGVYGANGVQYLGGNNVGTKILRNVFHDIALGVYVKHANADSEGTGAEIAYNLMRACNSGFYGNPTRIHFHDNLLIDADISLGDNGGGAQGSYDVIEHNTLVQSRVELANPSEGPVSHCRFVNNVFTEQVALSPYASGSQVPHASALDYNLYLPGALALLELGSSYSLESWRSHHGEDANSRAGAPIFVGGPGGNFPLDYTLTDESPGKRAAQDGKDMGADLSKLPNPS